MKIGILGAGNVARQLAALFTAAGDEVLLSEREPRAANGSEYSTGTFAEATAFGEIVIVAIPFSAAGEVLSAARENLRGKIVIDATNPLGADWSPIFLGEDSAGEQTARLLPEAKVVKAFNTIFADVMRRAADFKGQKITAFYCGDDPAANRAVGRLLEKIGFEPLETGGLKNARYLEAMAHLNIQIAVGMNGGTDAAFKYLR
jgi:8-hydroxy-5-deazaflavin:NADPH oxidoreductase